MICIVKQIPVRDRTSGLRGVNVVERSVAGLVTGFCLPVRDTVSGLRSVARMDGAAAHAAQKKKIAAVHTVTKNPVTRHTRHKNFLPVTLTETLGRTHT